MSFRKLIIQHATKPELPSSVSLIVTGVASSLCQNIRCTYNVNNVIDEVDLKYQFM